LPKEKDKGKNNDLQTTTQKTKDLATRNMDPLKFIGVNLGSPGGSAVHALLANQKDLVYLIIS
jgi:hypothetical protein